jgi:hypothetical protein
MSPDVNPFLVLLLALAVLAAYDLCARRRP